MADIEAVSLELAQAALRLEHLAARVQAENIARLGAGSPTLFSTQLDAAYDALRQSAASPMQASALARDVQRDASAVAGVHAVPAAPGASADDLVMAMTRTEGRYKALADGIARQYSLMTLAIRGAR